MLAAALHSAPEAVRLIECGFLTAEPGALAQAFHADTSNADMGACEASTYKVQLALVDVTALEPDAALAARVAGHLESVELLRRETVIDLSAEYGAAATAPLSSEGARRRPTSLGTVFASACRDELGAACCVINGGPIKGERAYADARVTFGELQTELPFPVKMVVVPARVAESGAPVAAPEEESVEEAPWALGEVPWPAAKPVARPQAWPQAWPPAWQPAW